MSEFYASSVLFIAIGDIPVLKPKGSLVGSVAMTSLFSAITELAKENPVVIVDFQEVSAINLAGALDLLGAIERFQSTQSRKTQVHFVRVVSEAVRDELDTVQFPYEEITAKECADMVVGKAKVSV